eukprot:GHRQ01039456.1.p1 GENE.GHRQ01039456.1~~GHRQ01039456.1.p1  ORF type:complete len:147 (-),score=22.40 GHRQ01039456.1:295-735(-)
MHWHVCCAAPSEAWHAQGCWAGRIALDQLAVISCPCVLHSNRGVCAILFALLPIPCRCARRLGWGAWRVRDWPLHQQSRMSALLLPPFSLQVRKAVGLGRMALDPLAVISTLLGRRKELLSLKLHELQAQLPQDLLATRLEQVQCC